MFSDAAFAVALNATTTTATAVSAVAAARTSKKFREEKSNQLGCLLGPVQTSSTNAPTYKQKQANDWYIEQQTHRRP